MQCIFITSTLFLSLQNDQVCVYQYSAVQEDFEDEVKVNLSLTTTVEVSCDAGKLRVHPYIAQTF